MRKKNQVINLVDIPLLTAVILLMIIGIITLYSVTYTTNSTNFFDLNTKHGKQFLWVIASLILGGVLLLIDANVYRKFAEYIYFITILLLIIVLFTPPIHGAKSWLGLGGLGIQPAEFAKISTALLLAKSIEQINPKLQSTTSILQFLAVLFIPIILVALQPDAGTLLVFSSYFFVIYREGVSFDPIIIFFVNKFRAVRIKSTWLGNHFIPFFFVIIVLGLLSLYLSTKTINFYGFNISGITLLYIIISLFAIVVLFILIFWGYARYRKNNLIILLGSYIFCVLVIGGITFSFHHLAAPHQKSRIELVLGLKEDPDGKDYNRTRAMAAVGSGGLYGKGYLQSSVSNVRTNHVPESETDFIFCPFAEERGLVGTIFLLSLYMFIILRIFYIAERQRSTFFRIYAYCVGMIFFYHIGINIGMNIGLAPVIGIPLPLMSYGGSAVLSFTIMIFILLKLDSQRKDVLR
jgi:rod shape determining protein RodA